MSEPKRHHYVPRFLLAGFAGADGTLHAHDLDTATFRIGTPEREGFKKNLYRMSDPDPGRAERFFADLEGRVALVVREMVKRRDLPCTRTDFEALLLFMALQSQRVIRSSRSIEEWLLSEGRRLRGEATAEELELLRLTRADMESDGHGDELRKKDFKSLDDIGVRLVDGEWRVDQDFIVGHILGTTKVVYENFRERTWHLVVVPDGLPDLITSDSPVNAIGGGPGPGRAGNYGYHLPDRVVAFALTRRFGILGHDDGVRRRRTSMAHTQLIGIMNWATLMGASRFAWSRRPRVYYVSGTRVFTDTSYIAGLRRKHREQQQSSQD